MHALLLGLASLAAALFAAPVGAQQTVKIGLIMPYSGQFADPATQMDNAIKLYMKQKGARWQGRKSRSSARTRAGWPRTWPSASPRS